MATINKITLPNGDSYDIEDKNAVTGVKGNAESSYRSGQVNLTAANIGAAPTSHTHSANDLNSGYINIHPENTPIVIPFMNNDIAHLLKRGGSAVLKHDGTIITNKDMTSLFDGSGSYFSYPATELSNINEIIIEITCHRTFSYVNWMYIDFGNVGWRAKSVKIEVMNSSSSYTDNWTQKYITTTNANGHIAFSMSHQPVGAANTGGGFNKIRFTLSDFASNKFRISQIGIYNYGSMGLRETYMSRGADDYVFRNITPNSNNTYNLGTSSNKWANVYATTFTGNLTGNVTGNVSGSAGSVAWSGITSKPTTLSGYGITDAKIASGTITLGSDTITPLTSSSTLNAAKLSGAIPSAVTATTQASTDNSTKIATTAYVTTAITNLPEPMIFKGSVGTGGTITSLPTAAASNEGWTYKVITALSSPAAKVGDTVISNGSSWVVIPSGDEPSGTVTNITAGSGLSIGTTAGGSLTTTGTINHTNSVTAQTTQAVYPIKIDAQGHISAYGSAQTILSLGTGSSNAFRGDYGNSAYAHAVTNKGSAFSSGLYKITTNSEGHVTAATAVAKSDITGLGIPGSDTTYTFDGTYNASTNKAATVSTVTNAINALDGTISGSAGAGKTLTAFSQTDGKVSATFGNISITKSQVSDFAHNHDDRYYTETESDAKYVTLSTAQTISGVKTFSVMPIAKAGVRVSNTGNTEGCDFVYDDATQSVLMSFH